MNRGICLWQNMAGFFRILRKLIPQFIANQVGDVEASVVPQCIGNQVDDVKASVIPQCIANLVDDVKASFYFLLWLTDQTSLLEFLHILTTNHKVIFAPGNNEPEFIAGMCHWLLVMGTQNRRTSEPVTSTPIKDMDSAAISQSTVTLTPFKSLNWLNHE